MATRARERIVVVGDLNGAYDVLVDILRGTKLVNRELQWRGGRDELVQMGDLFNRGDGGPQALRLLLKLQRQARKVGGNVTVLLGNHEVMTALGHEGYCTEGEYLSFASAQERRAWPARVTRAMKRLVRQRPQGILLPIEPRLEAWKIEHVPGRAALRKELGPRGRLGRALRTLPVAYQTQGSLFLHAGLLPDWAELGVDGLNDLARDTWALARDGLWSLPKHSLFRSPTGPLWDRSLVRGGAKARALLKRSLSQLGAARMIVGHTTTESLTGGAAGSVLLLAGGRLVAVDVGLSSGPNTPRTALILDGPRGLEWTPNGTRVLWSSRGVRPPTWQSPSARRGPGPRRAAAVR
jgi:Calcineurin-like phosphoesterase